MSLVTSQEIISTLKLSKLGFLGRFIAYLFLRITKITALNRISDQLKLKHKKETVFVERFLERVGVDFEIPQKDFQKIPKSGAFITISNHPLGCVDGLILLKILAGFRDDYKIIANFLLQRTPIKSCFFPVNPFENHKDAQSSIGGIKMALAHLKKGSPLGIFPAGEVATFREGQQIVDKPWEKSAIRLIRKAGVPVIPIYFKAKNSPFFYFLSWLSPLLRTVKLPSEILNQKNRKIKIRIGNPISVAEQNTYKNIDAYGDFLRESTFVLHHTLQQNQYEKKPKKEAAPIAPNISKNLLIKDINALEADDLILETEAYNLYFAKYEQIPNIIREIAVIREHAFRMVGEGTQNEIDFDKYDTYYRHLILWDKKNQAIVGGYRLGLGDEIFSKYGKKGFYLNDFFEFKNESEDFLATSIEMGRAFVAPSYQGKNMSLLLLLKGVFTVGKKYPNLTKLVGSVSVSDHFSCFSKSLMISFFNRYFKDSYFSKGIKTRKKYQVSFTPKNFNAILERTNGDIQKLEAQIIALDPAEIKGVPTLFKRYLQLNSKVIGFAIDPDFSNCLDVLMYVNFDDLPKDGFFKNM